MSSSSMHWSLAALQELSRRAAPSVASASTPLTLSTTSAFLVRHVADSPVAQSLLLVPRAGRGIAGIELQSQTHPFIATDALSHSRCKRLLQMYMMRKGFRQQPSAEETAATRFLLLHSNHLVANALGAHHALPVYAHSLAQLTRLSSHAFSTLDPAQCLVSRQFVEWENWREVVAEPGWELHIGDAHLAQAVVSGALKPGEIPFVTEKADLQPVKSTSYCC